MAVCLPAMDESRFVGFGPEVNVYTYSGVAIGGDLLFGFNLSSHLAAGLKLAIFNDLDTITVSDYQAFFRYYLPFTKQGLFAQADVGFALIFKGNEYSPSFSGGLSAGWRFNFGKFLLLEPTVSFGYPYMWAVTLIVGHRQKGNASE